MNTAGIRVLVLDDEEAGLYVKEKILTQAGYEVLTARTGRQALQVVAAHSPEVAILDVQLPDMSGLEVCARIKQKHAAVLTLQTSATFVRGKDRAVGLDSGADAYLTEPLEPEELLATVRALLRIAEAEAELRNANESLEQRVQQRTQELAEINQKLLREIADRETAEASLRQAQKMEALGQLTGGITHDFNNLLTVIYGGLETVQRKVKLQDPKAIKAVENSLVATRRAAALTERLLAFARREPLQSQPSDARQLVRNAAEILRRTLGDSVELKVELAADAWWVDVDTNQFDSCLLNLAVNARDAMMPFGTLTIAVDNRVLDEAFARQLGNLPSGEYVTIAVRDTGKGIPPEILNKVFDPFFSTKPMGQGTGLGLSQVYGFAKQSGGSVQIQSKLNSGTTVTLFLPRTTRIPTAPTAQLSAAPNVAAGVLVLVVEDHDAVRAHSTLLLNELGHQVLEASDAAGALEILKANAGIKLLFTDVKLGGAVDGFQLARLAKDFRPNLKCLYTTGFVQELRFDPSLPLLRKPFTFNDLAAKLRDILV